MTNRAHYFVRADFCKSMTDKASSVESRERRLSLAAKWLALADETFGDQVIDDFTAAVARVQPS